MCAAVVSTKNGKISGKIVEVKAEEAKPVHVYRQIPFAKPPIGKLRFMPPQPAEPWKGVKDGTTVGAMPMFQFDKMELMNKLFPFARPDGDFVTSEDCLHLTVHTPCPQKGKKLPVMVWLYGGAFEIGSERDYDGCALAGMNDVVVVIPNYRVGIFGFFSLGKNSVCNGNAGIMDQQLALRWVQENIEDFGGDKDNVTIFGQSAGGVSVHLQMVSPLSRGLFHKAISFSGQIYIPILFNGEEENDKLKEVTMKHYKINDNDDTKILEAMQNIPANELISVSSVHAKSKFQFAPMVDGKIFEKTTRQYLAENEFAKVPYIIGCNNTESFGLFGGFAGPDFEKGLSEEMSRVMIFFSLPDEGWEKCKEFYETDKMGIERFSKLFGYIQGDALFVAPASHAAEVHSASGAPVYQFVGKYQLKMHHDAEYGKDVGKKSPWSICDHGDDIFLTFGQAFSAYPMSNGARLSKEEEDLSREWMRYITNFAKTGDPNQGEKVNTQWPKYNTSGEHLVVDHKMSTAKDFRPKEVKFWMETMSAYTKLNV